VKKKRKVFWITDQVKVMHKERALLLNAKDYDIQFFTSIDQLFKELDKKRAAIIVISDGAEKDFTINALKALMSLPQIQGARMILTTELHSKEVKFLASVASFRDIIPMDLSDKQFLQRFIFATANKSLPFIQPAGQVTLNNISAVSMPARITWVSKNRLRIECRAKPPVGSMLNLKGEIAKKIGVNSISLRVIENQRSHLIYRFSEAMICEWKVPQTAKEQAESLIESIKVDGPNQRCRVFIGAQSSSLRNELMAQFDDPRFEVSAALQRQSLVNEPKFFTPHAVVVEGSLITTDNALSFKEMMKNIGSSTIVIIIGAAIDIANLRSSFPHHKLVHYETIPANLSKAVVKKYAPVSNEHHADKEAIYITAENPLSMIEISFSARLTRIHPIAVQISLPFPIGQFALCRIESPLLHKTLGRSPYMKFTATYQDLKPDIGPYKHLADGYLADIDTSDRKKIGQTLANIIYEQMGRFDVFDHRLPTDRGEVERTPELGSVKSIGITPMHEMAARSFQSIPKEYQDKANRKPQQSSESQPLKISAITTSQEAIEREPVSMSEIVSIKEPRRRIKLGKVADKDFADMLRPGKGQVAETVNEIKKNIKETTTSKDFILAAKYVAIVVFMSLAFWGLFSVMSKNYERSGKGYTNSIKKFAPNHFKRFNKKDEP